MANLTQVTLAGGVPTNSGTVSTVDALMADGGQATLGAKADAASTASDVTPISAISIWKQISKSAQAIAASIAGSLTVANAGTFAVQAAVAPGASETKVTAATIGTGGVGYLGWLSTIAQSLAGTLTVASHAVTNAGTFAVQATIAAGTALIGIVKIGDGTNTATVGVYGTAPGAVNALNVNASITNANGNGRKTPGNSSPVVMASQDYQDFPQNTGSTAIKGQSGSSGATGDWLDFIDIFPESTSPGQVTLQDGANTAVVIFFGGASSVSSLVPFTVAIRANSAAGAWKVVTGAAVHIRAVGNFT